MQNCEFCIIILTLFCTFQFWSGFRLVGQCAVVALVSPWPCLPGVQGSPRLDLFAQRAELAALSAVSHTAHRALLYITVNCYRAFKSYWLVNKAVTGPAYRTDTARTARVRGVSFNTGVVSNMASRVHSRNPVVFHSHSVLSTRPGYRTRNSIVNQCIYIYQQQLRSRHTSRVITWRYTCPNAFYCHKVYSANSFLAGCQPTARK